MLQSSCKTRQGWLLERAEALQQELSFAWADLSQREENVLLGAELGYLHMESYPDLPLPSHTPREFRAARTREEEADSCTMEVVSFLRLFAKKPLFTTLAHQVERKNHQLFRYQQPAGKPAWWQHGSLHYWGAQRL